MTDIAEITEPALQSRVRRRYSKEIAALETLGFRLLAFKLEKHGPFSSVSKISLLPLMRRAGEVIVYPFPLRLGLASVLLVHFEPAAIAGCMAMGVKLFTNFSDQTLVISSTLRSHVALQNLVVPQSGLRVIRTAPQPTIEEAWAVHRQEIAALEAQGKTIRNTSSFADYARISERETEDLQMRSNSIPAVELRS
jgi:hypothetical protein